MPLYSVPVAIAIALTSVTDSRGYRQLCRLGHRASVGQVTKESDKHLLSNTIDSPLYGAGLPQRRRDARRAGAGAQQRSCITRKADFAHQAQVFISIRKRSDGYRFREKASLRGAF